MPGDPAVVEAIMNLPEGTLFVVVSDDPPDVVYERTAFDQIECLVGTTRTIHRLDAGSIGPFNIHNNVPPHWRRIEPVDADTAARFHMLVLHGAHDRAVTLLLGPPTQ